MATETPTGKYLNKNDADATHFIELYDDHTFIYYYQKDTLVETVKSTWQLMQEKNATKIFFSAWRSFGPYKEKGCSNCAWSVVLKDGELFFSQLLRKEMNFIKE